MQNNEIPDQEVENQLIRQQPVSKRRIGPNFRGVVRECLAVLMWTYGIVKLFVFDIDIFFFQKFFPGYEWLVNYRLVVLLAVFSIIWLFAGNKEVIGWLLYIACYPLIIILWKIPFFVFKKGSWILAIATVDVFVSFFKSFKHSFITSSFLIVSVVLILNFSNEWLIWASVLILLFLICVIYVYRLILAFEPSSLYKAYNSFFSVARKAQASLQETFAKVQASQPQQPSAQSQPVVFDESMKDMPIESLEKTLRDQRISALQLNVFLNRICLYGARKLDDYQKSSMSIVFSSLTIIFLVILTTFIFAVVNFGLYKINKDFFVVSAAPSFFTFLYYSFNNVINNASSEISASTALSQVVRMLQGLFSLFLLVITVSLLIPATTQKHAKEIEQVIDDLEIRGESIESYIKGEFRVNNIEDAMVLLVKLEAGLADFLYKMSERIR